jgi:hypothetical protein
MIHVSSKALVLSAVTGLGAAGMLALASPAQAAQSTTSFDCAGVGTITIRVNTNNSSDNGGWGAAQVVTGGHGIANSFGFTITDHATGTSQSFVQPKSVGNANANTTGTHTTCSQSQDGTVGDFLNPGEAPPPGMSASDPATATVTVGVVLKA